MMRTISINEFEALIARNDWLREEDYEVVDRLNRQIERWDEEDGSLELVDIPHV